MKKHLLLVSFVAIGLIPARLWAQNAEAGGHSMGTLDKLLLDVSISNIQLGGDNEEIEESLDDIYAFGASLSVPVSPYFALFTNVTQTNIKGDISENGSSLTWDVTIVSLTGGARLHLLPDQRINPFLVASYTYANLDYDVESGSEKGSDSDSESSISYGAGVEFNINEKMSVIGSFTRTTPQDDDEEESTALPTDGTDSEEDRDTVSVSFNFWLNPQFLTRLLYSYELESETASYGLGLGLTF